MIIILPMAAQGNNPGAAGGSTHRSFDEDVVIRLTYNCHFDEALDLLGNTTSIDTDPIEWSFFRGVVLWHDLVYLDSAMANSMGTVSRSFAFQNVPIATR